jgi:BASS family bile acid:Na+ symporter
MLSMGITLTPQDFVKVAARPNATLMQFTLCYGMMPLLALGLGTAFKLDPALMAGMVLVGSINGGQASNLCTYIARGNVALSVLMTTATTLGAIVMTPLLCKGLLGAVVPVDAAGIAKSTIQVRYVGFFARVFFCISAPICITCVYDFNDERMSDLRE